MKQQKVKIKDWLSLALIVGLAVGLRFWLAEMTVVKVDLATYQLWGLDTIVHGLRGFYDYSSCDYPPGYVLVLWLVSKTYWWFMNKGIVFNADLAYKTLPILIDGVNLVLVYWLFNRLKLINKVWWVLAFLCFWPAWWIVSAQWGQTDGLLMMLLLGSFLMLMGGKWGASAVILGFAQAVKPVAVLSLPIYLLYLGKRGQLKKALGYCLLFGLGVGMSYWPVRGEGNLMLFIFQQQEEVVKTWPYLSLNSFNIWALFSGVKEGLITRTEIGEWFGVSQRIWGWGLFMLFWLGSLLRGLVTKKEISERWMIKSLAITYMAMFMFMTGMHERHLYYGLFWGVLATAVGMPWRVVWGLSFAYLANLKYTIWVVDHLGPSWTTEGVHLAVAVVLGVFLYGWGYMIRDERVYKIKNRNESD